MQLCSMPRVAFLIKRPDACACLQSFPAPLPSMPRVYSLCILSSPSHPSSPGAPWPLLVPATPTPPPLYLPTTSLLN